MKRHLLSVFFLLLLTAAAGHAEELKHADQPPLRLTLRCARPDARYQCGETVAFELVARRGGQLVDIKCQYDLRYCARSRRIIEAGEVEVKNGRAVIEAALDQPGFLLCRAWTADCKIANESTAGAAVEPEKIVVSTPEAPDFDRFWQDGLKRQAACPPVELEKLDAYSTDSYTSYLVKVPAIDGTVIYGFLTEPNAPGKYPAVVQLPGAGPGYCDPNTEWAARGVIALRMNVHAYRPAGSAEAIKKQYQETYGTKLNYLRQNTTDPEKHVYRRAHLAISRAIDFVAARPNFDGRHFVAYGSSQGGTLGMAMAALNRHLTAVAALVPGFGDHAGYLSGRSNSHLLIPHGDDPEKLALAQRTAGYFDSALFARRIRIPVLMSAGYIDATCTPASVYAIYNQIAAPKRMIDSIRGPHAVLPEVKAEMMRFLFEHLEYGNKATK